MVPTNTTFGLTLEFSTTYPSNTTNLEISSICLSNTTALNFSSADLFNTTGNNNATTVSLPRICTWQLPIVNWIWLFTLLIGIIGNVLTFLVIFSNKTFHNVSYLIICCIAVSDFLYCLSAATWIISIIGYLDPNSFRNYQKQERCVSDSVFAFVNDFVRNLLDVSYMSSAYFIVVLSVFRFIIVYKPLKSKLILNKYVVCSTVVIVWLVPVLFYTLKDVLGTDIANPTANIIHSQLSYAFPLIFIIIFHTMKIVVLKRNQFGNTDKVLKRMEKNVAAVILAFFLLPLPWQIFRLLDVTSIYKADYLLQAISGLLMQTNNCINPILYAFLSPQIRKRAVKMVNYPFRFLCKCDNAVLVATSYRKRESYSVSTDFTLYNSDNNVQSINIKM